MTPELRVKRIYDEPSEDDGFRILVDRLWPRGVSKEAAAIDLWAKELTPSNELRKWFHAEPNRHDEFAARYMAELDSRHASIMKVMNAIDASTVTLVTATKDLERGHTATLVQFLRDAM